MNCRIWIHAILKSCRSSFCDFGEWLPKNEVMKTVLMLVRLARMDFEAAAGLCPAEALKWLNVALEIEKELGAANRF